MTKHQLSKTLHLEVWNTPLTGQRLALYRDNAGLVTFDRSEARALVQALQKALEATQDDVSGR